MNDSLLNEKGCRVKELIFHVVTSWFIGDLHEWNHFIFHFLLIWNYFISFHFSFFIFHLQYFFHSNVLTFCTSNRFSLITTSCVDYNDHQMARGCVENILLMWQKNIYVISTSYNSQSREESQDIWGSHGKQPTRGSLTCKPIDPPAQVPTWMAHAMHA